jgi:hypothetical protein
MGACTNINQIALNTNRQKSVSSSDFEELRQTKIVLETILSELADFEFKVKNAIWQ